MTTKLKIFEMFAGYGGASFGLAKAGITYEVVGFSEIDKYAAQCYHQNHHFTLNYGDCTKIKAENIGHFDLLTGGFPCQSFSTAGKGLGEEDTRGTLFNDIIRIAEVKQPKYMLLENVKGLLSKKHEQTFNKILSELNRIGYNVEYKILNTKDYGIPQNRERVFFVCFRKDLNINFNFPPKEVLTLFLKDILEEEVEQKYFLSDKTIQGIIKSNYRERKPQTKNICNTLKVGGDHKCILVKNATKKGFIEAYAGDGLSLEYPNSKTRRGRVQDQTSSTLQCTDNKGVVLSDLTLRKLTPGEYFRLMGFLENEIDLSLLSDTQKYKLAGNGWDINLVSKIFKQMFTNK